MVNFVILLALGLVASEKLDRTYLPPPGSKFAGGTAGDLQVPLEPPKETFPTLRPQSGRIDGLPTLGDPQIELGISRGIPSGSEDLGAPGTNAPFTYFQNAYNVPTTTTSYAFSQTTTLPPGQAFDVTVPLNPATGIPQGPAGVFQTTPRPYEPQQNNQYTPDVVQYGTASPRPGSNLQLGYVYPTPEEQANNIRPTFGPGVQLQSFNKYGTQQPILSGSSGSNYQTPSNVQSYNQQSYVSPTSQQSTTNIPFGNAGQIPNFVQSNSQQDSAQYPYGQRPVNIGQQSIPPTVVPITPTQLPGNSPFNQQNLGQFTQDQGSLNPGQLGFIPSTTTAPGTFGSQSAGSSQFDNNFNNVQPFYPNANTPQIGFPGQDGNQFIPSSNAGSIYRPNIYQGSSMSQQYPSIIGGLGDRNVYNGDRNSYNPTTTGAPVTYPPNFSSLSGMQNSSPRLPAGAISPEGVYSLASTTSLPSPQQGSGLVRYKIRPERPQAESDRNAVILNYENVRTPDGYSYSYDTSNGIHAEESGIVTDGTKAQGSYSYIGDDGKLYSVTYTADENGFQPRGDHIPTAPPIPEAIQRVIEQAARDREAGISDDGSYDEVKYGHKNYHNENIPHDHRGTVTNGADIPEMIIQMRTLQVKPQNDQIRPVSTVEDYGANDYEDGQDYEKDKIINSGNQPDSNQSSEEDKVGDSQVNNSFQDVKQRPAKYPGSLQTTQDLAQKPKDFYETSNQNGEKGSDNLLGTEDNNDRNTISSTSQRPELVNSRKQSTMGRPKENEQYESNTVNNESRKPQFAGNLNDNTNAYDGRQTPSSLDNKNNQPSFNPRTEFTTLQSINEETGYDYTRPKNQFSQGGDRFPSRFMEINKPSSERKQSSSALTTAKPFITPNIYGYDEETEDDNDQNVSSPIVSTSKYDEQRPGYGQSTTPDQIIGDDEVSYTTVSAPRKLYPSSTRRPYDAQITARPYQYTTSDQVAFDKGSPHLVQKATLRPGYKGDSRYTSITPFGTPTGFGSTTPMPSNLAPQSVTENTRYQTTYRPTTGASYPDVSPGLPGRPGASRTPGQVGSTQSLPSTTYRPTYTDDETANKLAPAIKVDGFGRPIGQYNQFSDGTTNPSESSVYPSGNNQDTRLSRPTQRPSSGEGVKSTFKSVPRIGVPVSVQGTTSRPLSGFNQSTQRIFGEDFSGPKRPQTFDPKTGYHYK